MPSSPPNAAADSRRSRRRKNAKRRPLRASADHPVTQLWYARQGIVTPEMEFIAIRENIGRAKIAEMSKDLVRDDLDKQHAGSAQLAGVADHRTRPTVATTSPLSSAAFRSASPPKSPRNLSATKWLPAARSFRSTSITRNPSR